MEFLDDDKENVLEELRSKDRQINEDDLKELQEICLGLKKSIEAAEESIQNGSHIFKILDEANVSK